MSFVAWSSMRAMRGEMTSAVPPRAIAEELVAEGFSRSCRHDEEDVAAIGGGAADGFLVGAKGFEAEGLVEQGGEVHSACSVSHIVRAESEG